MSAEVEVTEADRLTYIAIDEPYKKYHPAILAGQWDNYRKLREIARHRIASTTPKDEAIAELVETLDYALTVMDAVDEIAPLGKLATMLRIKARALIAKHGGKP